MIPGIESFRKWFAEYSEQYVIIGGTACDLLMTRDDFDFRATRDIDMVMVLESKCCICSAECGDVFIKFSCNGNGPV